MIQKRMFFPSSLMLRLSPHLDQHATLTKSEDLRGQGSKLILLMDFLFQFNGRNEGPPADDNTAH